MRPNIIGQVAKFHTPLPDENPNQLYVVLEIIEDDERQAAAMQELLGGPGVEITAARSAKEALAQIEKKDFECVIVDLTLPDLSGLELLEKVHEAQGNPTSPPLQIYQRLSNLPRAFLVAQASKPDTGATVLDMVAKSDPRTQAFVDEVAIEGEAGFQELDAQNKGAGEINLEFSCDKPGVVVVSESWHPDWRAFDNGSSVKLHRVNHAQLGVPVSAGTHKLQFRYEPWDLYVGIALAGSVLIAIFIAGLVRVFRGQEPQITLAMPADHCRNREG